MYYYHLFLLLLGSVLLEASPAPVPYGTKAKCATCWAQCAGWFAGCAAACGPFEVFTPIACANCVVIFGASQQCFQCIEKCETLPAAKVATPDAPPLGRKLLEATAGYPIDCGTLTNKCTGTPGPKGTPQGLCTVPKYARKVDNHGKECARFGAASACDIGVAANKNCEPASLPNGLRLVY